MRGYFIVQFRGRVEQSWKDAVSAVGAELLDYIPDYAFKVRMTPAQAALVRAQGDVAWVGIFHPGFKLNPNLKRNGQGLYVVRVERGANAQPAGAASARRCWVGARKFPGDHFFLTPSRQLIIMAIARELSAPGR